MPKIPLVDEFLLLSDFELRGVEAPKAQRLDSLLIFELRPSLLQWESP